MSANPYTPGSVDYYKYQVQQSQKSDAQKAQEQAQQQLAYQAYQKANLEAQQKAIQTGQSQTITKQDIQAAQQNVLDTKYVNQSLSTPDQKVYSIPVVTQQARDDAVRANYSGYQRANLEAQQKSIALQNSALVRQNYELFKQNQLMITPGGYTAYGRVPIHYSIELNDSLSGRRIEKQGPRNPADTGSWSVNISDTLGVQEKIRPLPSNPTTGALWESQNMVDDWFLGAQGTGYGIASIFTGLAGTPLSNYTRTQVEKLGAEANAKERPSASSAAIDATVKRALGDTKAYDDLINMGQIAPGFVAGSTAVTVASFIGPGLVAKGATKARTLLKGVFEFLGEEESALPKPGAAASHLENIKNLNARYANERARFGAASIDAKPLDYSFKRSKLISSELGKMANAEDFSPISSRYYPKDISVFQAPREPPSTGHSRVETTFQKPITQLEQPKTITEAEKIQQDLDKDVARVTQTDEGAKTQSDMQQAAKTAQQTLLGESSATSGTVAAEQVIPGISEQAPSKAPA